MKQDKQTKYFTILTTGRTGSDYLQSCLDGVPGILTLPGQTYYKNFFDSLKKDFKNIKNEELIDFFLIKYTNLFIEDKIENKKANIDIVKFKKIFLEISKNQKLTKRIFVENIFKTYLNISKKKNKKFKAIVNHSHTVTETDFFLELFPESKLLVTIRNPLENLKSGIENWRKYEKKYYGERNYFYTKRILYDLRFAKRFKRKVFFVKLENCFYKKEKLKLSKFLGVKYSNKINIATYNGKIWIGDKLSQNRTTDGSFNYRLLKPKKNNFYSQKDISTLSYLYKEYKKFGYLNKYNLSFGKRVRYFFNCFLPLEFEKKTFIEKPLKFDNYKFFIKRIILCLCNL